MAASDDPGREARETKIGSYAVPDWMLRVRLPLQLLFIGWVYQAACSGTGSLVRLDG